MIASWGSPLVIRIPEGHGFDGTVHIDARIGPYSGVGITVVCSEGGWIKIYGYKWGYDAYSGYFGIDRSGSVAYVEIVGYSPDIYVYDADGTLRYHLYLDRQYAYGSYDSRFKIEIRYTSASFTRPSEAGLLSWFDNPEIVVSEDNGDYRVHVDDVDVEFEPGDTLKTTGISAYNDELKVMLYANHFSNTWTFKVYGIAESVEKKGSGIPEFTFPVLVATALLSAAILVAAEGKLESY